MVEVVVEEKREVRSASLVALMEAAATPESMSRPRVEVRRQRYMKPKQFMFIYVSVVRLDEAFVLQLQEVEGSILLHASRISNIYLTSANE